MASQREIEQWLQEGITAAKAGQYDEARFRLLDVVEENQTNETAWFWLYQLFDHSEDKRICLENLVTINPHNTWASTELRKYLQPSAPGVWPQSGPPQDGYVAADVSSPAKKGAVTPTARPVTLKLMIAFWVGISLTFLAGGMIASSQWLTSIIRARTFPNQITIIQAFELLVAVGFVLAGLIGLAVAILLFVRSMAGFYGSIVLALGLLLVGPLVSLIVDPPNYLTLVCTGGISGMIVLLTLASQPGFRDG